MADTIAGDLALSHRPRVTCGVALAPDDFQIVGALGGEINCDRSLLSPDFDPDFRIHDRPVNLNRHHQVKDLVAAYTPRLTFPGFAAGIRHQQTRLVDSHGGDGLSCANEVGHLITGSVTNRGDRTRAQGWWEIQQLVEYLSIHTANALPAYVIHNGERCMFLKAIPVSPADDIDVESWRALTGSIWW